MKVKELIEALSRYDGDLEIAVGDLQFGCCNKDIYIEDNFKVDSSNEIHHEDDYSKEEWDDFKDELEPIILIL